MVAPGASANYGRIAASTGCDRTVSWQASSSTEGSDAERTNQRVQVQYREVGTDAWTDAGPVGSFTAANGFTFSGSFPLPGGVDAVELRVQPLAPWGPDADGAAPGTPRFATTSVPEACDRSPLAATAEPDCGRGAVVVRARNVGDRRLEAEVLVDRVVSRTLELDPGGATELTVPVLAGRSTDVEVRSGELIAARLDAGAACASQGAGAVVNERCNEPGRLVVLAGGGPEPAALEVRVRGTTVDRAEVRAGDVLQRTLEVPAQELPVEVLLDGQPAAAGLVGGCTGPVAGLLGCGTAGRPPCDLRATRPAPPPAPPPPPPPLTAEQGGPALPRTGPGQRAIALLLGGVLFLAGGTTLAARDRRAPAASLLEESVASYRQPWWDES